MSPKALQSGTAEKKTYGRNGLSAQVQRHHLARATLMCQNAENRTTMAAIEEHWNNINATNIDVAMGQNPREMGTGLEHHHGNYMAKDVMSFWPPISATKEDDKSEGNKSEAAPILALPEGSEDFVVYCDASHKGLGAVLMQREKVIAYASRQLKVHEEKLYTA
ncbi:putative reverse transcriptase domain-containing protein [Tanacetum coccineum]